MGVEEHVDDLLTYQIWNIFTRKSITRSAILSADPERGVIINKQVNFDPTDD